LDDAYAIRLAKTELREGYDSGDVERVLAVFADECNDLSVGQPSFFGAEAKLVLRHRLRALFARCRARLAVTIISISVQGAVAFDWGWHKLTLTPRSGGRAVSTRTRYLEIWQKQADGQWKIVIFLDNLDVRPQMPPAEVLRAMGGRRPRRAPRKRSRKRRQPSRRTA
jgi:ketosteroid isomerase-like protein